MIRYHKKILLQKKELQRLDLINKQFFSIISHDIRSPLSGLFMVVSSLLDKDLHTKEGQQTLKLIIEQSDNLLHFLNDLLFWSKKQISKEETTLTNFKASEVIAPIKTLYGSICSSKSIQLVFESTDTIIYADKDIYSFVIRNLISNAIKFSYPNGKIIIKVKENQSQTITIVEDQGVGISPENIKRITDTQEFFTTQGTSNESGTGFGINTSIEYLKKLNGYLKLESVSGNGTKAMAVLPKKNN